jgi:phosphoglycerol transferase
MLATIACLVPILELWRADARVPFSYKGDALLNQSIVKSILEYGWYGTNPRLGAPFGSELYDYPVANGNNLHAVLIAGLGLFSSDSGLVTNAFFLLSFPLAAMTAYLVLRSFSLSAPAAIGCAVLFALAPFHFLRGEGQLFLAAYYTVPLGVYLVIAVFTGRPLFRRGSGSSPLARVSARTLGTLALCALVGSASIYYAAFTIALLVASGLLVSLARRRVRPLGTAALLAALIGTTVLLNLSPSLAYRLEHGRNSEVATRGAGETESLGLKVADLVLPVEGHRLPPLAHVTARYRSTTPIGGENAGALGIVGTLGFLALLAAFLARALTAGREPPNLFLALGATVTLSLLIADIGGFATLISYLISPQIRAWNRIAVFIAFACLAAVGLLLERLRGRLRPSGFVAVVAVVVVVGLLDQTSAATVPPYDDLAVAYRSDQAFVSSIEQQLPSGAMVLQLPYLSFPEAQNSRFGGRLSAAMGDYDHFREYLHSSSLRWSYGAMRGRPADWAFALQPLSVPTTVLAAATDGFQGIVIDRAGYYDAGRAIEAAFRLALGTEPTVSADGTLSFFDLTAYREPLGRLKPAQLRAIQWMTLFPLRLEVGNDFWAPDRDLNRVWRWSRRPRAELHLVNPSRIRRVVRVTALVRSAARGAVPVLVTTPDGVTKTIRVDERGARLALRLVLRPGVNRVTIDASRLHPFRPPLPDLRYPLYFRLEQLSVRESTFARQLGTDPQLRPLLRVPSEEDFLP